MKHKSMVYKKKITRQQQSLENIQIRRDFKQKYPNDINYGTSGSVSLNVHYVGNKELKYVVKKGDNTRENKNEVRIYKEINKRDELGKLIHSDIYDHTPYMYGISEKDRKINIALEYLGEEDNWHSLFELIYNVVSFNTQSPLNEQSRLKSLSVVLKKVEEAMKIFHENGFIHNDINQKMYLLI
jgi:serine/threonine protein kinase